MSTRAFLFETMPQKELVLNKKQDKIRYDYFIVDYDIVMTIS